MKPFTAALVCLTLGVAACRSSSFDHEGPVGARNLWVNEHIRQASLREAILTQSTLYPYHFVVGSDELNSLGWRDMEILAPHFVAHGGTLSVRRGDASQELYAERLQRVETALAAAGVEAGRVRVTDSAPGGPGITSEGVLQVLEKASQEMQVQDAGTTSQSGGTTSQSGTAAGSQ